MNDRDKAQLERVKALLASVEYEMKSNFDEQPGPYFNGFRDGSATAIEAVRQRIAGAMFDFSVTVEPKPE